MKREGGWVFISHSHLDVEAVRRIRNMLEERGFEPLMFYLKCLNDDDEIESLIRREINEREWFIYVDSPNAERSHWVRSEREYIASLKGKKVFTIRIGENLKAQVDHLARQLKVFVSYSARDEAIFKAIKQRLVAKEFLVFDPNEMMPGENIGDTISAAMDASAREGFVLLLISEHSMNSELVLREAAYAADAGGKIVPVYVGDAHLSPELMPLLGELQGVHIDREPTEEQLDEIISQILHRITYYDADFTALVGFRGARHIRYPAVGTIPDYTFWDCDQLESVYIPPCVVYISDQAFQDGQDVLIECEAGSYAEQYCIRRGLRYRVV